VRRILTWGLVAAVAALGLAAGLAALRGGEEPEPAAATTAGETEPAERTLAVAGADLRRAGVPEGRLVYSDDDCAAHSLLLPSLAQRPAHDMAACESGSDSLGPVEAVRAECTRGRLTLATGSFDDPELYARGRGCSAAWKPDGTVTFVRDGEIRRFVGCRDDPPSAPLICSEPVLTRVELARRLPEALWRHAFPRIRELRWLDDLRLAAVVQSRTPEEWVDFLVLFDRGRLVGEPTGPYAELGGLKPSPTGSRVAAADIERGGVVAIDSAGRRIELALDDGHAIVWSPDEEWVAEATEGGVYVWRADDERPELIQIPVAARDVLWTASPGDDRPALEGAAAELRAAGIPRGTLTYADERCRNHDLALPSLEEMGQRSGYEGLCRYRAVVGGLVETIGPPRSPDWRVEATCGGGVLRLWQREFGVDEPHLVARARGCGAAWKPDGTVSFIQDGEARGFVRCPGDGEGMPLLCSEPVLTRAELARQLRGGSWIVRELHWLDETRLAAIVRDRGFDYLALFEHGRLLRAPVYGFEGLQGLRPSPQGRFVAAYERSGTIVIVGSAGKPVHLPIQRGGGIVWSRNEKWVAVATEGGIWVFRADGTGPAPIRIPIPAQDVLWTEP
jgi:hypothetical protein